MTRHLEKAWGDGVGGKTPISASALKDLETRVREEIANTEALSPSVVSDSSGDSASPIVAASGNRHRALRDFISVRDFGAKGDGTTDDTTAIQEALEAAQKLTESGSFAGDVYVPPSPSKAAYKFSNLIIPQGVTLRGASMFSTRLERIAGSTGIAIRDSERGAIGTSVRDLFIDCNECEGNGLDLGNRGGEAGDFQSFGEVENVVVKRSKAIAVNLNPDAVVIKNVWGEKSEIGVKLTGHGNNAILYIAGVENTLHDIVIKSQGEAIHGLHVEPKEPSGASILFEESGNAAYGVTAALRANVTTLIQVASGITNIRLTKVQATTSGHTLTTLIEPASFSSSKIAGGTGTLRVADWQYGGTAYYVDTATGRQRLTAAPAYQTETTPSSEVLTVNAGARVVRVGKGTIKEIPVVEPGQRVTLVFTWGEEQTKLVDGSNLKLKENFTATPDDTVTLVCDATNWFEVGRSVN